MGLWGQTRIQPIFWRVEKGKPVSDPLFGRVEFDGSKMGRVKVRSTFATLSFDNKM